MISVRCLLLALLSMSLIPASTLMAQTSFNIGQRIELKATHPLGVPLHRESRSSLFGRAPDRSKAKIMDLNANQRWLRCYQLNSC